MKQLLGIVVLGLLLSSSIVNAKIKVKNRQVLLKDGNIIHVVTNSASFSPKRADHVAKDYCKSKNKNFEYTGGERERELTEIYKSKGYGLGIYKRVMEFQCISSNTKVTSNNSNSTNNQTSTNDKIANSKKICKELGFKANTEKFSDCSLKMMALQFETGNKVSNNDGSSTQKIIIQQQDDFDIGDFFFGLQKIVDDNYRSTNNSSNQGTNCRIVPKAWGADMVCR